MNFRSRKAQIESDFLGQIVKALKEDNCVLTRKARKVIKEELRSAAMVGAAEERWRALNIVSHDSDAAHKITSQSVLAVLGYE